MPELVIREENLITQADGTKALPEIPAGTTNLYLYLYSCPSLTSLPNLPASLENLNLTSCPSLTSLPNLPDSLETLNLRNCVSLESLPQNLPASLRKLNLSGCKNLKSYPEILPASLNVLDISYCESLTSLPELPDSLENLNLTNCTNLTSLPVTLPNSLKTLNLTSCTNLTSLPKLPASLENLNLTDCTNLTSLPELPASLETLNLTTCTNLTSLPELPASLRELYLSDCTNLTSLPELPDSLENLDIFSCNGLTSLPVFPTGIIRLNLGSRKNLKSLPEILPASLKELYLSSSTSLTSLPELPTGITRLNLRLCTNLTSLPELPASLRELYLSGCDNLQATPKLLSNLESLERSGCQVTYPLHFNFDSQAKKAKEKLEAAIESYMNPSNSESVNESNSSSSSSLKLSSSSSSNGAPKPRPAAIKTLLHRFLTESVGQRGSSQATNSRQALPELVAATTPVLDAFTKNPNHLEIAEEIAKRFLDGCVNQPVAGWSEISAITSIAMAPEIADKIAATKHLRALEVVTNYVATFPGKKIGQEVEVEAGNVLFREVHKKLLENQEIENPWLGVPNSIAYEGIVKKQLTKAKINQAYQQTIQILDQTPQKVADYLCKGIHQETWAKIAFPNETNQIKNSYEKEMEFLDDAIEKQSQSQSSQSLLSQSQSIKFNDLNLNLNLEIDEPTKQLFAAKYFNEDGNLKSLPELQDLYQNLPERRSAEIFAKSKELTLEAIENSLNPQKTESPSTEVENATSEPLKKRRRER